MVDGLWQQVIQKEKRKSKEFEKYFSEKEEVEKLIRLNKEEKKREKSLNLLKQSKYKKDLDEQVREKDTREPSDVLTGAELKLNKITPETFY